jgi:hypothetical protein
MKKDKKEKKTKVTKIPEEYTAVDGLLVPWESSIDKQKTKVIWLCENGYSIYKIFGEFFVILKKDPKARPVQYYEVRQFNGVAQFQDFFDKTRDKHLVYITNVHFNGRGVLAGIVRFKEEG